MTEFSVHVRTEHQRISYTAIASNSADIAEAAVDMFGICYVFVRACQ